LPNGPQGILRARGEEQDLKPITFDESYWAYSTKFDEEIAVGALLATPENKLNAEAAYNVYRSTQNSLAVERASLQVHVIQQAEQLKHRDFDNFSEAVRLSILIDHSGSMRGDKVQIAIMIAECAAQMADKLDIPFEVLGFTTTKWRGDPVRTIWTKRGKPENPGRLCALRHIVYSDFASNKPFDMRAMYLPDLLKENIDGEAILWATQRARETDTKHHLTLVVSDGVPVDDSTLTDNVNGFLLNHLKSVVRNLNAGQRHQIAGVGLDHDVSSIYPSAIKLNFFGDVEQAFLPFLVDQIIKTAVVHKLMRTQNGRYGDGR